ncbi:hypothetical protein GQR58_024726 [Nymphon striatum]|nr:hypothetical protein GQR58_024726 [Nymphon striatum]
MAERNAVEELIRSITLYGIKYGMTFYPGNNIKRRRLTYDATKCTTKECRTGAISKTFSHLKECKRRHKLSQFKTGCRLHNYEPALQVGTVNRSVESPSSEDGRGDSDEEERNERTYPPPRKILPKKVENKIETWQWKGQRNQQEEKLRAFNAFKASLTGSRPTFEIENISKFIRFMSRNRISHVDGAIIVLGHTPPPPPRRTTCPHLHHLLCFRMRGYITRSRSINQTKTRVSWKMGSSLRLNNLGICVVMESLWCESRKETVESTEWELMGLCDVTNDKLSLPGLRNHGWTKHENQLVEYHCMIYTTLRFFEGSVGVVLYLLIWTY